ncbi:Thioesterase/thiol ester dehydrase-isomerase [Hesseltinella vesiculosa]|uniref:Thioesterase/thiol ester dehydrase-isomerase n=1 Tax=Hesseltinella vesiculosa TaxID=101127 RepID=A0A1X2GQ27_9FUNG|nr:Thioesterase/thiol ester dehydrase-isomerase [Hesseltinella vesiculosa]
MVAKHVAVSGSAKTLKPPSYRERSHYKYFLPIQTRWSDNDQYGHINNSIYYHYIDTVVNEYLIRHCGLTPQDPTQTKPIGLVVASSANFYAPASYPSVIQAGLAIVKRGRSSVQYRIGLFENEEPLAACVGSSTHVFVDAKTRRPVQQLPEAMARGLSSLESNDQQ